MKLPYTLEQRQTLVGYYPQLHRLLDVCYPKPPRDVFYGLMEGYRPGFPAWLAFNAEGNLVGFVYLAPHSKGGTLENLAVDPDYRGLGIGQTLVQALMAATPGLISLTTRIPDFFRRQGFEAVRTLPDASVFMIHLQFPPAAPVVAAVHPEAS